MCSRPREGPELAAAAAASRAPSAGDREAAENRLGRLLRQVPAGVRPPELDEAAVRLGLARHFYNDAVRDTRSLRRRRLSRLLRLHASRPWPRYFDIDDGLDAVHPGAAGLPAPGGPATTA
jgi:hypothetical protein